MLKRLCVADGSWQALKDDWRKKCESHEEDFGTYAIATFSALEPLAQENPVDAGVYALDDEGDLTAVCQVNCTRLPGYDGPVVRHMIFDPDFDFGNYEIDEYAGVLVQLFSGVLTLSTGEFAARYLKFHLRSPADRQFFAALRSPLSQLPMFQEVNLQGAWLYVTKTQ